MSLFKNTWWIKRIAIFISFLIVSLILWNTYVFFQKFKVEEHAKMEVYAAALKELNDNVNLDASVELPYKILKNNTTIPSILVNEDGSIYSYYNLDSTKAKNPKYVALQLAKMKKENSPIEVSYRGKNKVYVYYKNSDLLHKLTYYPLALILILVLFLTVVYTMFHSTKIAEQNKLWVGMAKETAHQIGTPLSSLLGWIAILRTKRVDDKYIDEIEKDVYRLNTIANRFSKIGSLPQLKKENVVEVAKQTFDYLQLRSSEQVTFLFTSSPEVIYGNINIELFSWVIENLIKNAIDAMQGKGKVTLQIGEIGNKIKITISDTGKGITKSQVRQIFKPGFTTKKRGWGLGLSLSKRIINDYHKGKIYVKKTELGKGTTFEILLNKL
ncbi:sensor histidine kinase [Tenacibaculum sp. UWU-22]|uniref:sensor histidine kinase n=1 Tax=Tenacibaculum sp. UWU-22 TaxID=3234187 RepID=UPI0034DB2848